MTPSPVPKRSPSTAWIIIAVILAMGCGLATAAVLMVRSFFTSLTAPREPVPIVAIAPLVTRHAGGDETIYRVDWTLAPDARPHCYGSIDSSVQVELPDGGSAEGADVIGLWGTDLGERSSVHHTQASVDVWPCRGGTLHVYAQLAGVGAAEIPCTYDPNFASGSHGPVPGFRCKGTLDPKAQLALPPPPACKTDALTPLFDLVAPGACFGLSALELSHLPYPSIHVSTSTYEDFRPWPSPDANAPRFEIPLKGSASSFTFDSSDEKAAALYPKVTAIFAGPAYAPTCDPNGRTKEVWTTPAGTVTLSAELDGCDPKKATRLDLKVKQHP